MIAGVVALLLGVVLGGCEGRALEVVLCGDEVAPYVAEWSGSLWGLHDHAYVKLITPDQQSTELVMKSCTIAKEPFTAVEFPNGSPLSMFPEWWGLKRDEVVDHASLARYGGNWQGIVYRTRAPQGVVWLMFAGS